MAKTQKLGRGLDILLGQTATKATLSDGETLQTLGINQLQRGKFQPRDNVDPDTLNELAESITAQGIIQPLIVRKLAHRQFEIIAGERRWRAAKMAGLKEVPVIVRDIDDQVALAIALIENIQREALTPLEEARALQQLIEDFHMTHAEISHVVGRSRSSVSNLIRLLQLTDAVKAFMHNNQLEMGHARALLSLEPEMQVMIANQVINKSLSVRQTEDLVKKTLDPKPKQPALEPAPHISKMAQLLSQKLNTKTEIKTNGDRGKIIIHYESNAMLEDVLKHLH